MEVNETFDSPRARASHSSPLEQGARAELMNAAEDAGAAMEELCRVFGTVVERQAQEAPYRVIGVAAGLGFVLGGGLAWKMIGGFLNVASRIAVTHAFEGWINAAVAHAARSDAPVPSDPTGRRFSAE